MLTHFGCVNGGAARRNALPGFTLVELMVTIGIICVLVALLLTAVTAVHNQANMVTCASNERQIGQAMLAYTRDNGECLFNMRDYGRWTDQTNPNNQIDPNNMYAYWGVPYAAYGAKKQLFACPSCRSLPGGATDDGSFEDGNIYHAYSMNGYGGRWSGFPSALRKTLFQGSDRICALFQETPGTPGGTPFSTVEWVGRPLGHLGSGDRLIVFQEGYEQTLDGNGDTFVDWYQWTPPNYPVDLSYEWLRHFNTGNVLFADWHVGRLSRTDQSDVRYYTGIW